MSFSYSINSLGRLDVGSLTVRLSFSPAVAALTPSPSTSADTGKCSASVVICTWCYLTNSCCHLSYITTHTLCGQQILLSMFTPSSSAVCLFGVAHKVFILHALQSCDTSLCTPVSFMSFLTTSLHFSFDLPIFQCLLTSIFRVLIALFSCFFSKCFNHLSLTVLGFSLMFATPALHPISSVLITSSQSS